MESGLKWLEAIVTVVFDLEEGQLPDLIIPEGYGTEKDRKIISYNSFPDSYTINLEGQTVYSFYLRKGTRIANEDSKDGPYDIIHCYACFNQKKDPSNARGFFQKSVVFLTKTKLYNFFKGLFEDIARAYFQTGSDDLLREVYKTMNNEWPQPDQIPDFHEVSLLGKKYQVVFCYEIKSEKNFSYKSRLNQEPSPKRGLFTPDNLSRHDDEEAPLSMKKELSTPARINHLGDDMELPAQRKTSIGLCDDFKNINLFQLMGRQRICLILKLWETVMLNESLLILADSPLVCSELVFALQSLVAPFESSAEVYPYVTVFDKEVDLIRKAYPKSRDGFIIGATNPLFVKNFEDLPNILRMDKDFEESILKKNLISKTVKTSSFFKSEVMKRAKGESFIKKFLTKDLSQEAPDTNNSIIRKKIEKLSLGVAGLISTYFSNQKNVDFI